ncbi:Glycine oxidase ThiO [hydrothermal vent metagenome]|uniref:Glycine oxidase ThiO n=1 Tax=hydrothermal vent metagenome TaxID=652676 RepID=A0A1W1E7P5_9ZZZZ
MNIAIAGAGLAGRVVALNLLQSGDHTITFFEKDSKEGVSAAGFTAAGMLAPYAELETAESVIFELGKRSIELWPALLKEIGLFDGYQQRGTIVTAHPQDMGELEHFIGMLQRKVDSAESIKMLDKTQIGTLEPDLAMHPKGFFIPEEGVVDAQRFMAFSVNYFDRMQNVHFREYTPVEKLEPKKVHTKEGVETFDWVFDTRGLGAKEHFSNLRGVRGEVLWVEANDIDITRPTRLMHPRYKLYIVPRGNGCEGIDLEYCADCKLSQTTGYKRYLIGATEIESEDVSPISVRSSMELLSALYTVHPNFGEARVVNSETNCRPAFKDNLPRIENEEGLTRINGLYRHGYLLSPAIVEKALNEGIRKMQ